MIGFRDAAVLRHTSSEVLVRDYARRCNEAFRPDGVPVVIAARNEETDLPATLAALSRSSLPVWPIVSENGSDDRTADFAAAMGAHVVTGGEHKMHALQLAVGEYLQGGGSRSLLFTDADTLAGPRWVASMLSRLPKDDRPGAVLGTVRYAHGERLRVDVARTAYAFMKDLRTLVQRRRGVGRGANMALHFDRNGSLLADYLALPKRLFVGEEERIADLVEAYGGVVRRNLTYPAIVTTRGDRFFTFKDLWAVSGSEGMKRRQRQYEEVYGESVGRHEVPADSKDTPNAG